MILEALLVPISDISPCGEDLNNGAEHDAIEAARQEDDPSDVDHEWAPAQLRRADWNLVAQLCQTLLQVQSKDLQACAWLGEAWIALHGAAGGRNAVTLVHALCERYWPDLYPRIREGDAVYRIGALGRADRYWAQAVLLRLPLVNAGGAGHPATLADWRAAQARENEDRKRKDNRKDAADGQAHARLLKSLAALPVAALRDAAGGVRAWLAGLAALNDDLARRLPDADVRLTQLETVLQELDGVLRHCLEQHPGYAAGAAPDQPGAQDGIRETAGDGVDDADPAPAAGAGPALPVQPVQPSFPPSFPDTRAGRHAAYQHLQHIAAYLARIEPHSPVPSLIRRAVEWGEMSFDQLMAELMQNNGELQKILLRQR
jgi:type VI secretion system protein ImpA